MAPPSRALNPLEQKIHQACITHDKKTLTQKEIDALVPDLNARVPAINFLLGTGMLKIMQDDKKNISYKAVMKKEMEVKKEMGGDENMVLNHIQTSGNEGIWTKHLKGKTELHQTVINRCLKSLEQKGLVKVVKSVKYPTRKIYMMSHLEPSVEVTGGPWYSENELDTEFIKMLASACLRFIQDKSYPKSTFTWEDGAPPASAAPLYPISQSTSYHTSKQIHSWLQKTKLSEQELGVEHVEMLLDVLVFDGEVERLPAYGAGMWDMGAMDEDSEDERRERKRKRKAEEEERKKRKKVKGKKRTKDESSDEVSEEEAQKKRKKRKVKEESDDSGTASKKKKGKKRKREESNEDSDSESGSDSDDDRRKTKKRKRSSSKSTKSKSKSKSKRRSPSPSSSESDSESDADSSDSSTSSRKKKKKKTSSSSKAKGKGKSKSVFAMDSEQSDADSDGLVDMGGMGSANVYRAVRQERVSLGWSQAPCGRCPVFDFCNETGPVNPKECSYYGDWVQQGVADF